MSEYGYLGCKDCNVMVYIGKWSSDKTTFNDGQLSQVDIGSKVLKFVSGHLNHDVFAGSDEGGNIEDEYFNIYNVVDKEYEKN